MDLATFTGRCNRTSQPFADRFGFELTDDADSVDDDHDSAYDPGDGDSDNDDENLDDYGDDSDDDNGDDPDEPDAPILRPRNAPTDAGGTTGVNRNKVITVLDEDEDERG